MNIIGSSLAAIAAWCVLAPACAQQQTQDGSAVDDAGVINRVIVTGRHFHLEPSQFKNYEYTYFLSNGDVVRFTRRVRRFYVTLKGRPEVQIYATALDKFETEGGAKMVFTEDGDKLTIKRYEELRRAFGVPLQESGVSVTATLAAPR
jgi:hypothetical protein